MCKLWAHSKEWLVEGSGQDGLKPRFFLFYNLKTQMHKFFFSVATYLFTLILTYIGKIIPAILPAMGTML